MLVGHDLGGGVAQILAVKHPELVRGLVLTNAISYDSWPIPQVKLLRATGPVVERLPDGVFQFIYANFMLQGHGDRQKAEEAVSQHFPYYERADGAAAFMRQVRSLDVRDTLAVAEKYPNSGYRPASCGARRTNFRTSATATGSRTNSTPRWSA